MLPASEFYGKSLGHRPDIEIDSSALVPLFVPLSIPLNAFSLAAPRGLIKESCERDNSLAAGTD